MLIPAPGTSHLAGISGFPLKTGNNRVKYCCILRELYGRFTATLTANMATLRKRGNRIQAEVCRNGLRRAKTFESKAAARIWAAEQELEISRGERGDIPDKTFSDLLDRYAEEVSRGKKGSRWELVRIKAIKRTRIAKVRLKDLSKTDAAVWRDERLKTVSGSTVNREKNLLSNACSIAVTEWRWLKLNPFAKLRMPKESAHRERLMSDDERKRLGEAAISERLKAVLRAADFAVETGMRKGEICGLREIHGNTATLKDTKSGTARKVPLSARAVELWSEGPLDLTVDQLDFNWRQLCKLAGIEDLHFHDHRHLAATRLAKKLNLLELCKMFGWKDPRHALIYFNATAEDIAKKL